nr:sensor histidine kinase [Kibdelosporangium sp. MJ126-NF4]CEL12840.1 two-component system sensor kinase [Kibdelosporangium sp. MJ126-NF4]CTQ98526.1 two-component system sensor kinase [Kibdelosporangium sp. MJ126-NF4]
MDDASPTFARRLRRGQLVAIDAVAAVGYTAVLITFVVTQPVEVAGHVPVWAQCLIVAAVGLPVALRRIWPLPVFGVVLATTLLSVLLNMARDPFLATACTLYVVALDRTRRSWAPRLAIGVLGAAGLFGVRISVTPFWWMNGIGMLLYGAAALGGAWLLGRAVQDHWEAMELAARRLTEQAVTEERLRIARELHDIVAHSMGVIAVKASVANHVLAERPPEAHDALRVIEATSRDALAEMRQMLGLLRAEAAEDGVAWAPLPGPAGLPGLAAAAEMVGVRVDMDVRGVADLPDGLGRAVYRIVQEALTNVMKHAAPAHCRVVVDADGDDVRIVVTDDGPGHRLLPTAPDAGHGLVGMRERAALYGGTFTAGPRPDRGFEVAIRLPHLRG